MASPLAHPCAAFTETILFADTLPARGRADGEQFQELDGFSLEDYKPFADIEAGMGRLVRFVDAALHGAGERVIKVNEDVFELRHTTGEGALRFTTSRDLARDDEGIDLLGLDHPVIVNALDRWRSVRAEQLGGAVQEMDRSRVWFPRGGSMRRVEANRSTDGHAGSRLTRDVG